MQGQHIIDAIEGTIIDHHWRTTLMLATRSLFGGLEQEAHFAAQLTRGKFLLEQMRNAKQHRGMCIVAAGVHIPGCLRDKIVIGRLNNRQRIHIGANTKRWAIVGADFANNASDSNTSADADTANLA
jgi:hypothetical protein